MALLDINALVTGLGASDGGGALLPLIGLVLGMFVYSLFIFKFYKFMAKKDMFELREDDRAFGKALYALQYVFMFPLAAFAWFLVTALLLALFSQTLAIEDVFIVSAATTAIIRLAAYYKEELSEMLANLLPFTMLAIFMIDLTSLSQETAFTVIAGLPAAGDSLAYYFGFLVVLELGLKALAKSRFLKGKPTD
jgi:hypothetical protein